MFGKRGGASPVTRRIRESQNSQRKGVYLHWLNHLFIRSSEAVMRKYIRHPSDIPIDFQIDEQSPLVVVNVKDVSRGGLCFKTNHPMRKGVKIQIHIPIEYRISESGNDQQDRDTQNLFEAQGVVAWCRKEEAGFAVGVQFADPDTQFGVRMVEQVCHIEHYRHDVLSAEGRCLTTEQAAREWVERYAAEFPAVN